jgi:hypothetical protein
VAGPAAAVGDDGRGPLHDGLPVGIGHVGDEDIARLDLIHVVGAMHHPGRAGADAMADTAAGGQDGALGAQVVALQDIAGAALDGLGTGLDHIEETIQPVLRPLDVHGPAIVVLDQDRLLGQFHDLGVGDGEAQTIRLRHLLGEDLLGATGLGIDHAQSLAAHIAAQHGGPARGQGRLVDIELVGIDGALDHHFAQAIAGGDKDGVAETRFRVQGKHDAGGGEVAAHHALDAGGEGDVAMLEALMDPVGNSPIVEQGGEHLLDAVLDVVQALDVEEGLLLTGEGGIRQVLGGGGGAHGPGDFAARLGHQLLVIVIDGGFEGGREGLFHDPAPEAGTDLGQLGDVVHVQIIEQGLDALVQSVLGQELAVGVGGGGEAAGDPHADFRKVMDHFAQGGVLAAHDGHIVHAQVAEPADVLGHFKSPSSCREETGVKRSQDSGRVG